MESPGPRRRPLWPAKDSVAAFAASPRTRVPSTSGLPLPPLAHAPRLPQSPVILVPSEPWLRAPLQSASVAQPSSPLASGTAAPSYEVPTVQPQSPCSRAGHLRMLQALRKSQQEPLEQLRRGPLTWGQAQGRGSGAVAGPSDNRRVKERGLPIDRSRLPRPPRTRSRVIDTQRAVDSERLHSGPSAGRVAEATQGSGSCTPRPAEESAQPSSSATSAARCASAPPAGVQGDGHAKARAVAQLQRLFFEELGRGQDANGAAALALRRLMDGPVGVAMGAATGGFLASGGQPSGAPAVVETSGSKVAIPGSLLGGAATAEEVIVDTESQRSSEAEPDTATTFASARHAEAVPMRPSPMIPRPSLRRPFGRRVAVQS
mmetsp:Transcript_70448/g.153026  ORF Transcript_70448/g.153026 Transcript_70448/m.153026 type:complete len:375 (+) Transcript_70448:111-1235(+)